MAYRYGRKIEKKKQWWEGDIEGSEEEQLESAEYQRSYLYKLLDYADKDEIPTPEEMKEMRRVYQYARQGPRAWHHRLNKRNILTSADVLYILTSTKASDRLSKSIGIDGRRIREIRSGKVPCWEWEFDLVRRIKAIVANKIKSSIIDRRKVYVLSKLVEPGKYEDLYLTAQKKYGVRFIRGRVSEVGENINHQLIVKAEDTLSSKPLKVTLDLLVLMCGMNNSSEGIKTASLIGLKADEDGFFETLNPMQGSIFSHKKGVFYAGAATGPKTLPETINEGRAAAICINNYIKEEINE